MKNLVTIQNYECEAWSKDAHENLVNIATQANIDHLYEKVGIEDSGWPLTVAYYECFYKKIKTNNDLREDNLTRLKDFYKRICEGVEMCAENGITEADSELATIKSQAEAAFVGYYAGVMAMREREAKVKKAIDAFNKQDKKYQPIIFDALREDCERDDVKYFNIASQMTTLEQEMKEFIEEGELLVDAIEVSINMGTEPNA